MSTVNRTMFALGVGVVGGLALAVMPGRTSTAVASQDTKPRVTISEETTRITEPLRADGYVDYVAALNQRFSEGVTPDNNAAVLLLQALGPDEIPAGIRQPYFERLCMTPLPEQGPYLVAYDEYVERVQGAVAPDKELSAEDQQKMWEDERAALTRPWSKEQLPTVAAWLEASAQPLALIVEASKRPRRYDPLIAPSNLSPAALNFAARPTAHGGRKAARALAARAMFRLNEGRLEEAWQDVLACHRLSRLTCQSATLIDALVAAAINSIASDADRALLAARYLTAAEARRMHADLEQLSSFTAIADAIDLAERFGYLDCAQNLAARGLGNIGGVVGDVAGGDTYESNLVEKILSSAGDVAVQWDVVLQMGNYWYDRFVAAQRKSTWAERCAAGNAVEQELHEVIAEVRNIKTLALSMLGGARRAVTERVGQLLVAIQVPALSACTEVESREAEGFEIVKLGFLLAVYRAEHGSYPATLSQLVPQFAAAVPQDFFTAKPLIYKRRENGYVLYSVGVNGKDDGGLSYNDRESSSNRHADYDDLVVQVPLRVREKQTQ